jgi:ABC-2 type transport system ATP-binding protein
LGLGIVEKTYALEIEGLTKSFGDKTVVSAVSFSVGAGDMFGFLGPNGSGKTTTIRIALGILRPDAGTVRLLNGLPAAEALPRVGYLPEERGLLRKEKVSNVIRFLGRLRGLSKSDALDRGLELLHRVGLYEHRDKKVEGLSRGMTQLVQFVASLIHHPELIILDEPFSGLDPLNVQLMKEMLAVEQARGSTVIFSTHVLSDVEEMCERCCRRSAVSSQ